MHGFSEASCHLWRGKFGGMSVPVTCPQKSRGPTSFYAWRAEYGGMEAESAT